MANNHRAYNLTYLKFHNNHIVRCPKEDCNNCLLGMRGSKVMTNHIRKILYECLSCGFTFYCCSTWRNINPKMKIKRKVGRPKQIIEVLVR